MSAEDIRAVIALHVLGPAPAARVGGVTLHDHQEDAVGRLQRILDDHGGALLADDVGLGKTFVALGVARRYRSVDVIAPAAVRDHWLHSATRAGVSIRFRSMESLSRGDAGSVETGLVIIDEAHHFRTTHTRRFAAATRLCAQAPVLLLSATPIQNRDADLRAILSLFLGARADALSNADVGRFIVRRVAADLGGGGARLPAVDPPRWLPEIDDVDCLDRILALPPAIAPTDGGDGGALVTLSLLRQWASSGAALSAALRRRIARGLAMMDALRAGRRPSRAELAAWCHVEDAQQLSFPELVMAPAGQDAPHLLTQVERHVQGARELLAWRAAAPDPDILRARALGSLLDRHRGERVIAFSEYADTVCALFRLMAPRTRAAMLTRGGGRLASGRISRADIIERFGAGAGARAHVRDRIDILITTDVLSEGVSLPDASVVVHLDLAWNPARLEQRIGRLRRVDSTHRSIAVHLMPPPAPAERLIRVQERLRVKHAMAHRALGTAGMVLPGDRAVAAPAAVRATERIASMLRAWRRPPVPRETGVVGGVRASESGALACARVRGVVTLLAVSDGGVSDDPACVERVCAAAAGESAPVDPDLARDIRQRVEQHLQAAEVTDVVARGAMHVARVRRALLRRADAIARSASREHRPRIAPALHAARIAATAPLSAGAERALEELAAADLPDDDWLRAIVTFAAMRSRRPMPHVEMLALLVLCPD